MTLPQAYVPAHEQLVVELYVRDLRYSISFYCQLGFELVREEPAFAALCWPEGEHSAQLYLEEFKQMPSPPPFPVANIRVMVPNVDDYWRLAKQMGVRIFKDIDDRYYGLRDFTLVGPDGMAIRFATNLAAAH